MSNNLVARAMFVVATSAAVLAGPTALVSGSAASAARGAEVFVEVTPRTVQAGEQVDIQASCDGNDQAANVRSDAFGRVAVRPDNGLLTGTATVQDRKPPNTYDVVLTCPNRATASTTLTVVNMSKATRGPATGAGGTSGGTVSPLVLTGGLGVVAVGAGVALAVRSRRGAGSGG
ncbi:hypothetical protein [Phytohabitans houttuyneae]|uniref:Uncharacterized protein n=1 Tax=Phytohabitans houttuyneae TaxID=1076126 RepID=A0A6V8JUC2_9ACTN|nr:hypothetical protein [Phytohabitans houttuyneae]GFJ76182.1 hypothetical protein Phou_003620 [Phytohabitans houttuyneae]